MRFDIVLALRHQPELDNFLQELYDPSSASYRHFVTPQEFTARFGPSQEDYDAVIHFAQSNGFTVTGGSRDAMDIQLRGTVAAIERAFHVTMGVYQHPTENRTYYAPDREPTVDLPFQLWHISGLDNYSIPHPASLHRNLQAPAVIHGSCPGNTYCGSDMRAAYYGQTDLTGAGQNVGLLEFLGYNIADVNTYFKNANQTLNVPITGVSTDGSSLTCKFPICDDAEQTLDITQAVSMAPGLTGLYMFVGATDTAMLSSMSTHAPLVSSIGSSWTWSPSDPKTDDPYFQKFSAQGQNYFQASGDSGAYTSHSQDVFPADDDFVTVVGGTDLITQSAGGPWASETAWVDSGGGIYNPDSIPIPAWQQLAGVINSQNQGSTTIRNSPDVSAEANQDFYVCADQRGCQGGFGGTSFAAPMWAGFMAMINQQAVANGNPPLGFINPALYNIGLGSGYGAAFHDITSGNNHCCGQITFWTAVAGYDLVTGWGSPNGVGLINALAGQAGPSFTLTASPSTLSIAQGSSGTSTITVVPSGGFSGSVSLSASGLPTGVTAGFNTNPTTSTSTLTLTVGGSAATGTSTVTITGVSGSITQTTTVTLTVTGGPSFTLTANPASLSIVQGTSGNSTITVVPAGGFTGSVTLSASGLPSGVTAGFSPNPTTTTSTLTLTASASAATGTSTVTISGVSGSLNASTTLSLTVTPSSTGPTVTVSPTSLLWGTVVLGATGAAKPVTLTNTGTSTLNISSITTSGDFAQTTSTKPCGSTLAAGKSCVIRVTFTPSQVGTRTGTLTITDNSPSSPQTVALSGTGGVQATLTPASRTFPAEKVGVSSPARVFTLANKQAVGLTGISISTTGDFSVSSTTCTSSLAAKSNCTISLVFTPTATGTRTGTLSVADSAIGSPQTSSLTGTGK
jgi:subtilase family serine protease